MAEHEEEVEVLDAEESRILTRDEIVGMIRNLPDPARGYCSWIFAGACDIVKELLAGRDLVRTITEINGAPADEAVQTATALTALSAFRQKALAFERKYGHLDVVNEFGDDLGDEIGPCGEPAIAVLLGDIDETIIMLLDEKGEDGDYDELLRARLNESDLPEEKKARFIRVFASLAAARDTLDIDIPETERPLVSVPDGDIEHLIGKLPAKQRALYAFMHNRLIGIIQAKTGDRLSVAEELLQEEISDEEELKTMLEQIAWSANLAPRISPSAERFAPKGNKPADELIEPILETVENDIETYMPLADGIRTLYSAAAALEAVAFPALSVSFGGEDSRKADAMAAELAEEFLMQGGFDADSDDEYPGLLCDDGDAIWHALRAKLSAAEAHRVGQALSHALYPLTKIGDDEKIYQRFLKVGHCPDDEAFGCTEECLVPLMAALCAYNEIEGKVPEAVLKVLYPTTQAAAEQASKDFDALVERLPSVLESLPEEFRSDVIMSFSAAAHLGQDFLLLPDDMRRQLYECKEGDSGFLDFLDAQMRTLVILGASASELVEVPEDSD